MCKTDSNPFNGFGVALTTPFKETGDVDYEALQKHVEMLCQNGADFLCVLGTTAETPTLSDEEKRKVRKTVADTVKGRIPLLVGAGGNHTQAICHELEQDRFDGYQGILIVCPFYNKPTQEGLFQHFMAVNRASHLPIVIYNIPGRTGVNLETKTLCRIIEKCPNVVAIKEAAGKLSQIEEFVRSTPAQFCVLCGDDGLALDALKSGAKGVISVVGNAYPKAFGQMVHRAIEGDLAAAGQLDTRMQPLYRLMMADGNPAGIKCLLSKLMPTANRLRLPLVPVSQAVENEIEAFCRQKLLSD